MREEKQILKKQFILRTLPQVAYWVVLISLTYALIALASEKSVGYTLKWIAVSFPFKLAIFYSYYYFFIRKWLNARPFAFIMVTLFICIAYPLLKIVIDQLVGVKSMEAIKLYVDSGQEGTFDFWLEYTRRLLTVILNVSMAFIIRFTVDWFRNRRITAQMEKYKLQSELALLRNQVNPHFLFNTLNNIDSMVYKVSEEASEAIMKLSAIMRYMLYESNTQFVQLTKEVEYLRSYFDLEQMRVKNKSQIRFEADIENPLAVISPMIFIPFVENAFKHATSAGEGIKVHCEIQEEVGVVHLMVANSFDPEIVTRKDKTGGIGIQNVKRRLELIYSNRFEMDVKQVRKEYILNLKLNLNEN